MTSVANRLLNAHIVPGSTYNVNVVAVGPPSVGGANHTYHITWQPLNKDEYDTAEIKFQEGPIAEVGSNGVTMEALLAICEDRLCSFQQGPFKSDYNQVAIEGLRRALGALHRRTLDRMERGVEGEPKV